VGLEPIYRGWGEQKIITVSFILLIRLLTAIQNFTANKENIT